MSFIASVATANPPYEVNQEDVSVLVQKIFNGKFRNLDRMLRVFEHSQIERRFVSAPLSWFSEQKSFQEKNELYIQMAVQLSEEVITRCLEADTFAKKVSVEEIDAIFFVSTTGIAAPTIDAYVMNHMSFSPYVKRIPIWGLGCNGGASGLSRAMEYCKAYPEHNALVVCVELCSLTFQHGDTTKSNLIGTSLFADGAACTLICGDDSQLIEKMKCELIPSFVDTQSVLMKDSLDVMGWDVQNEGLFVIFSKDIPTLVHNWFAKEVLHFLEKKDLHVGLLRTLIAHPGGQKVLDAYEESLQLKPDMLQVSRDVLRSFGNMSSATVMFVLEKIMKQSFKENDYGVICALGPGFCTEFALLQWKQRDGR
ncbi:type III polyketide synthase [Bacillus solimangrovi]|uniref:Chalcone synthase n=1 Tax=Bacillus solimangrovi TaxID=1305675 RepID=A0A1E5LFX3_9BACI|nr:3-oxoacyl-[acyl-carrier-protein] synthase III C-terminal domain-containing protein [Bacillus solimangrovi]OEH92979.1 chalcone synthase [Bacillus solimangrovi]